MKLRNLKDLFSQARLVGYSELEKNELDVARALLERTGEYAEDLFRNEMQKFSITDQLIWNVNSGNTVFVFVTSLKKPAEELKLTGIKLASNQIGNTIYPVVVFDVE